MTSERPPAYPTLYYMDGDDRPLLIGQKCSACGRIAFPRQAWGCERCGASGRAIDQIAIAARGTIASFAMVHRHQGKGIEAPFVIATVKLDDGPVIRPTMVERSDADLRIGARVHGVFVPAISAQGIPMRELRFTVGAP